MPIHTHTPPCEIDVQCVHTACPTERAEPFHTNAYLTGTCTQRTSHRERRVSSHRGVAYTRLHTAKSHRRGESVHIVQFTAYILQAYAHSVHLTGAGGVAWELPQRLKVPWTTCSEGGEPAASCAPSPFPHPQQPCSVPRLALKSHTNRNHSETGVDIVQRPTLSAIMLRSAAFPRLPAV